VIARANISQVGIMNITFDKPVKLPAAIFNLTSENDGPRFFNISFIPNPVNLQQLNLWSLPSESRRLQASDPYSFRWGILNSSGFQDLSFNFSFANPNLISKHEPDHVMISLLVENFITSFGNDQLAIDFKPKLLQLPQQFENPS
jgi:hypothetical protein